jgi:hypothetical protein
MFMARGVLCIEIRIWHLENPRTLRVSSAESVTSLAIPLLLVVTSFRCTKLIVQEVSLCRGKDAIPTSI